ncbi:MAG: hypothetical protein ABI665_09405 [Vicinamibacterales bacterium]
MSNSIDVGAVATEGKKSDSRFQRPVGVESVGKKTAIACFNGAIESFIVGQHQTRAWFAETLCGMSESNFSKVANGQQGDFWELVYRLPADVRSDFFDRLHESERIDPLQMAFEQVLLAMLRAMRLMGGAGLPERAAHMAKAAIEDRQRKTA